MKHLETKSDRNTSLHIKITTSEKDKIAEHAAEFGSTISEYFRTRLLALSTATSAGALRQDLARQLCRHADLVQAIDEENLRKKLVDWSEETWLCIKS